MGDRLEDEMEAMDRAETLMARGKDYGLEVPEVSLYAAGWSERCANQGRCLHVVLDDGNVEDDMVRSSIHDERDPACVPCLELAGALFLMSVTQRKKVGRRVCQMRWGRP